MYYSATDVYQTKREIINFLKSLVTIGNKVERKFVADSIFSILSSKSIILSDMNSLFQYMYKKEQNFIIRLTERRKLFWKGRWHKSTTLRDSRKGKVKINISFRNGGKKLEKTVYISHLNGKSTLF